jgi:hypothetical protein
MIGYSTQMEASGRKGLGSKIDQFSFLGAKLSPRGALDGTRSFILFRGLGDCWEALLVVPEYPTELARLLFFMLN